LEQEVHCLISSGSKDKSLIENTLDTILSLVDIGFGKNLFIELLEYYKTVDADGAAFYWNEFDKPDDE
jgi:hypothetical protein